MILTSKQKAAYLINPGICPCCDGRSLSIHFHIPENSRVHASIGCYQCDAMWIEEYTLTNVTTLEEVGTKNKFRDENI